jgi:hypothetical protein
VFAKAKQTRAPGGEHVTRRWKIDTNAVVFYFELARLSDSGERPAFAATSEIENSAP